MHNSRSFFSTFEITFQRFRAGDVAFSWQISRSSQVTISSHEHPLKCFRWRAKKCFESRAKSYRTNNRWKLNFASSGSEIEHNKYAPLIERKQHVVHITPLPPPPHLLFYSTSERATAWHNSCTWPNIRISFAIYSKLYSKKKFFWQC